MRANDIQYARRGDIAQRSLGRLIALLTWLPPPPPVCLNQGRRERPVVVVFVREELNRARPSKLMQVAQDSPASGREHPIRSARGAPGRAPLPGTISEVNKKFERPLFAREQGRRQLIGRLGSLALLHMQTNHATVPPVGALPSLSPPPL
jgi:hypothetical protein